MFWIIVAIIAVGWFIVSAINRSTDTRNKIAIYNSLNEEQKAQYNEQQYTAQQQAQTRAMLRKRDELYVHIYQLRRAGRKENKVATFNKVQNLAAQAGVSIGSGEDIKTITLTRDFLQANNLLTPFRNMVNDGLDDRSIAKKLGSGWNPDTNKYTWYKLYSEDDITDMRDKVLHGSKESIKDLTWTGL